MSSSESSDEDLMVRNMPTRESRGKRMRKLVGEEAEADSTFWEQEAWNADDDEDEEAYSTEEGFDAKCTIAHAQRK